MYINMYIYIYLYTYIYMYLYIYTYILYCIDNPIKLSTLNNNDDDDVYLNIDIGVLGCLHIYYKFKTVII
jgi:hypothetical protein